MTWVGATFAVLALVLLGGIAWYERSRPPSQIVALVAALAALAVAGRVAFAPIPNVLPSTDIILIAGYALGGGPGFAVGALTGLVSNFWLGQGPWTPWQMAGWGMVGVLGAMLARTTDGEIRRLPLALFCALAGLVYGALLDFHTMVTYGGEQSLDRYLALSARAIPFNVAHAAGNFVLALAAGPALIRMLRRYRDRFEFDWTGGGSPVRAGARGAAAAGCVVALLIASGDPAGQDARAAKTGEGGQVAKAAAKGPGAAVAYLRAAQNPDGGFGVEPDSASSPAMTGWAVLGLEAAGVNPLAVRSGAKTPIDYLRSTVSEITTTGDIERTILVLEAAGLDSRAFGGKDLVTRLQRRRGGDSSWGRQVNPTAFGVMALDAASVTAANRRSAAWLAASQNSDGGWGFTRGVPSEADSTGAALQALVAAGGSRGAINKGVAYLRGAQLQGGGFSLAGGGSPNSQSTAWAVQGLVAAGSSPRTLRRGGRSPLDYLASVQAGDGHYRYSAATDQTPVWVTGQGVQAAEQQAFPLAPVSAPQEKGKGSAAPSAPAPAPAAPAAPRPPGGGSKRKPKAPPPVPAPGEEGEPGVERFEPPPEAEIDPASATTDEDDEDSELPTYLAAGLLVLVLGGAAWLLRRQGARLSP